MSSAAASAGDGVRQLRSGDLDRVIAIDWAHVGEPRRRFFEKRLAHAERHPEDFLHVGVVRNGVLVGFAFASILRGEFGREHATATLDVVGVDRDSQERGVGHALMEGLVKAMRRKEVRSLQSQADWTNRSLLRFFDASGFSLAPRLVLQRSVAIPLAEAIDDA